MSCSPWGVDTPAPAARLRRRRTGTPPADSPASLVTSSPPRAVAAASHRRFARSRNISAAAPHPLPPSGKPPRSFQRSPRNNLAYEPPAHNRRPCPPSSHRPARGVPQAPPRRRNYGVGVPPPTPSRFARPRPGGAPARFHDWWSLPPAIPLSSSPPPSQTESARPTSSPDTATRDWSAPPAATPRWDGTFAALRPDSGSAPTAGWARQPPQTRFSLYACQPLYWDSAARRPNRHAGVSDLRPLVG